MAPVLEDERWRPRQARQRLRVLRVDARVEQLCFVPLATFHVPSSADEDAARVDDPEHRVSLLAGGDSASRISPISERACAVPGSRPSSAVDGLHRRAQPRALRRRSLDERQLRRLAVPRERSCRVSLDLAPLGLGGFTAGAAKKRLLVRRERVERAAIHEDREGLRPEDDIRRQPALRLVETVVDDRRRVELGAVESGHVTGGIVLVRAPRARNVIRATPPGRSPRVASR